ncbi:MULTISPECIES: AAA family ATPase [unclassified Massilia]|uniref:AAA family ATPase n=1 Tax=unclassified Massilia TaxID=2609279 RepID=UPI001780F841|nr:MULTISPECIES: AAA family ATPase [unclassified Massilia]MBD8528580.1 AAA family ATPase [Massilia sp. CFBP 13647]MBD8671797.1 AAA family ATPase [Massilia sp. CFBP 13721]
MRIEQIRLTNYRGHEDLTLDFEQRFNVIVGSNGSGKTSVLNSLCDALSALLINTPSSSGYHLVFSDPDIARIKAETVNGRVRFEPQYPVCVAARGIVLGTVCNWAISKSAPDTYPDYSGDSPSNVLAKTLKGLNPSDDSGNTVTLPLIAFYRATRQWNQPQPNELSAATSRHSRADGYSRWWDASNDSSALQGWVIAKCLERFQISSETGIAFDDIKDDELAMVNRALQEAVEGIKGLKYDLKQKSLLVEWQATNEGPRDSTSFQNLSHGQRAVIGLIADIARRICLLNPQLGLEATTKTNGVVLIDELDMHLHPRWQRLLTQGLKRAFPAIQFIVASHSPQVLGELHPDEIILLRPHGTVHPQVSYGLDSSQILEEIMGADARTESVDKRLSALFEALERNEIDVARREIELLKSDAPGIPELAGAEALLRRKEVLGR